MSYQQPGWGAPPPGQYGAPPQQYGQHPPPQQGHYPPPQQGQYPPQQGHYPPPQQGQYPPPQQGHYPPPQQGQYPPPQQYGQPYGAYPPGPQQGGYPPGPPQGSYGAPPGNYAPPQGYAAPPQAPTQPTPATLGYVKGQTANVDTRKDADGLRSAMKGFGTKDSELIRILTHIPDPLVMANLHSTFNSVLRRDLLSDIHSETSGYYRDGLEALVRGPLAQDVYNLEDALVGAGTNEQLLDDVLLCRSNADLQAIKQAYQAKTRRSLESDVRADLSMKTQQMYDMVLAARRQEDSAAVYPQNVDSAADALQRAMHGFDVDQITVCQILSSHSDGQIRAIAQAFRAKYQKDLGAVIKDKFSGHMEDALLRMLRCGEDRAMADAQALEDAMAGAGTKDKLLINRLVRLHWNKQHKQQVVAAYRHRFHRDLVERIKGEASGKYEDLMVALVRS